MVDQPALDPAAAAPRPLHHIEAAYRSLDQQGNRRPATISPVWICSSATMASSSGWEARDFSRLSGHISCMIGLHHGYHFPILSALLGVTLRQPQPYRNA